MPVSIKINHLLTVLITACVFICTGLQAGWQQSLTDAEIKALALSISGPGTLQRQRNGQKSTHLFLGLEVLLIELQEKKTKPEDSQRLAEVFVFDYATSTTSVKLLDVDTQNLVSSRRINTIHLPLNEREMAVALQWLLSDAELMSALRLEYEKQLGKTLESLEQVDMKVSIWNPGAGRADSHECNLYRCALVSLFTNNHYNFSVEPVVNLATGEINLDFVQ